MRRTAWRIAAVTVVLLVGLAFWPVYLVREYNNNAQLLWNANEAYLFADTTRLGWRQSGGALLLSTLRYAFGGMPPPDRRRHAVVVIRVDQSSVDHHVIQTTGARQYGIWDGRIFSPGAGLWAGNAFEPLNAERRILARQAAVQYGDFSDADGWSGRCCATHRAIGETVFAMELGGRPAALVVRSEPFTTLSVAVRQDGAPEREIWRMDLRVHHVSAAEYARIFSD